jgi:hypothetical protein
MNEDNEIEILTDVVNSMNEDLKNMVENEYPILDITYMTIEDGVKYNNYPDGTKEIVNDGNNILIFKHGKGGVNSTNKNIMDIDEMRFPFGIPQIPDSLLMTGKKIYDEPYQIVLSVPKDKIEEYRCGIFTIKNDNKES